MTGPTHDLRTNPAQQAMLLHSLSYPHDGMGIEQLVVRLGPTETLDVARLKQSFARVQARYEALRSAFDWSGEFIIQRVFSKASTPFETRPESLDDPSSEALFLGADRKRGFEPHIAPLFRVTTFQDGFVFSFHHAILDGRSYRIVLEEVLDDFDGITPANAREGLAIGEFCRLLSERDTRPSLGYFSQLLEGATETQLAATRVQSGPMARLEVRATWENTQPLEALCASGAFSLATAVNVAWSLALARLARVEDVVIGTTRAGRLPLVEGVKDLVGCFIDTLLLRISLDEKETARSLLESAHTQSRNLREHEHTPLSEILVTASLRLETLVVFERYTLQSAMQARGGLNTQRRFALHERSEVPLLLAAYQDGARLHLVLEHDANVLPRAEADLLLARVIAALRAFATTPDAPLGALNLYVDGEHAQLQSLARQKHPNTSPLTHVHETFAQVAQRRASDLAVRESSGAEITYRDFHARTQKIAAALRHAGVRAGVPVLVLLPRSIHWTLSILAIWAVDATYVPLDPAWPEGRLLDLHDDLLAHHEHLLVLVDEGTQPLAARALPRAVKLRVEEALAYTAVEPVACERELSRTAYVLYTSGTTGKPKGALLSHRALASHARAAIETFALTSSDRALQFTSLGFDVSIEEVIPTLLAGARVVLRSAHASTDFVAFDAEIAREEITVLNLPSAFFHEWMVHLSAKRQAIPRSVRLVVVGGERPTPESYARFYALDVGDAPRPRFINAYGPTEVTITSVACDTEAMSVPPDGKTEIPIGEPFGETRAYVVRTSSIETSLAGLECPGELWLAGPQVADGYLGRPEASAQAFVEDPFATPADTHRMAYRTGDLVRRRANGSLVFMGRIDRQLKLRGHRIEPSEIESALLQQPGVRDAAVVLAGEPPRAHLVAFVVADSVDRAALRDALAHQLPSYMVPSLFERIETLPLTPTGKVDRATLAHLGVQAMHVEVEPTIRQVPANDLEAWMAPVFAEALGLREMDLNKSLFELGGHSLLAVRILARLKRERPDLALDLAVLLAHPSVHSLASALEASAQVGAHALVRLNAKRPEAEGRTPLFCLGGVQLYSHLAYAMENDRPVYGAFLPIEARALEDRNTEFDIVSMSREYRALIQRQQPHGPYLIGGLSVSGLFAYEVASQLRAAGEEVELLLLFDTFLPRIQRGRMDWLRDGVARTKEQAAKVLASLTRSDHEVSPEKIRDVVLKRAGNEYDRFIRPYPGEIMLFRAEKDRDPRLDLHWSEYALRSLAVHVVEGDHVGIMLSPGTKQIAGIVRQRLGSFH